MPFLEASAAIRQRRQREEHGYRSQITREPLDRVRGYVQRAKAEGIEVVFGGGPNEELGGLLPADALPRAAARCEIVQHEVVAPSSRSNGSQ